jgi:tetratricopeptide (TPR) repeat protein
MTKLLTTWLIVMLAGTALAAGPSPNGVRCSLSIEQWDSAGSRDRLLWTDTADFLKGSIVTGFAAGLSIDVNVTAFDTLSAEMMVHAYTFTPQPKHGARNFNIEYGLPGRIDNLVGKNGARYTLIIMPLQPVNIDTTWCPYSHHDAEDFAIDPSAHMNIYYVKRTLADYYWNSIKGMMEEEYDNFNRIVNFSMPGKYLFFVCPCKINTVIWDDRFAMMIDPVRSTMFAVYAKEYNSVFPFIISQAAVFRNYGYAPAFLADGFANYLSFAIHDVKKMKQENRLVRLDSLLDTHAYYQADPTMSDGISATFVRYLVDKYQIGRFLELYRKADDLNLRSLIVSTYGKSIPALEAEWLQYIDTLTVPYGQAAYHAGISETRLDYTTAHDYAKDMLKSAGNLRDSLEALNELSRTAFFLGDYSTATIRQSEVINLIDSLSGEWIQRAGYRMMNGEYDSAAADLTRARSLDSANSLVPFNQGVYRLFVGDTVGARQLFTQVVKSGGQTGGMLEAQVMLGNILAHSAVAADKTEAITQYNSVVAALTQQDTRHNPSASQMMWLGIAYLGLGDTQNAEDYLQTAQFLETRMFYQGMINLWLGKVADVRGERAVARDYYQKVLAGQSAQYHQEEARLLLKRPYKR